MVWPWRTPPAGSDLGQAGLQGLVAGLILLPAGLTFPPPGLSQAPANPSPAALNLRGGAPELAIPWHRSGGAGPPSSPGSGLPEPMCAVASSSQAIPLQTPVLLQPGQGDHDAAGSHAAAASHDDYRRHLASSPLGWPRLDRWCVWLEPGSSVGSASIWEQRWWQATRQALQHWQAMLPIELVDEPAAAQIRIRRQRPPRQQGADGRLRASHGRSSLQLLEVTRSGRARPEPTVEVLISPDQRPLAIEATALHELGHAFGLWGHSPHPEDAMAAIPGALPVLELSRRDQATLRWLYAQPTRFGLLP